MKQKTLILGAGSFQKGLISYLKDQGFYTICVTNKPHEISALEADKVLDVSYLEISEVLKIFEQENAAQIFCVASDLALPTQSAVQSHFKLRGLQKEEVDFFADKWNYKSLLNQTSLAPITRRVEKTEELAGFLKEVDLIIGKPKSGSGSKGILKISSAEKADLLPPQKLKEYIFEGYIEGNELGCDLFILDGTIAYACPTHKETNTRGVPMGHLILSGLQNESLLAYLNRLKKALKLNDGFYNLDIMQQGEQYYLLDISPRLGGNCIPEVIHLGYGVHEYELLTKWFFQKTISPLIVSFRKNVGVYIIHSEEKGMLLSKEENDHPFKKHEVELFWNKRVGDTIEVFDQGAHHMGYFIFSANSNEELLELFEEIKSYSWFALEKH